MYVQQAVGGDEFVFASDLGGVMHQINWRLRDGISFGCPDLGMVNGENSILYLYQTSPRQPQKGYRPNAVSAVLFNAWDLRNVARNPEPSDPEVLRNLFFPKYYTAEDAFTRLLDGETTGCAISSRLGLYVSKADKYPNIAYKRNTVGHMQSPRRAFIVRKYAEISPEITKKMPGVEVTLL